MTHSEYMKRWHAANKPATKAWRDRNRARLRGYEKKYRENRRKMRTKWSQGPKGRAYRARQREKHRQKINARQKLRYAVRIGKVIKKPCWCGEVEVQAHHTDYAKPLKVTWLCRNHHHQRHNTKKPYEKECHCA